MSTPKKELPEHTKKAPPKKAVKKKVVKPVPEDNDEIVDAIIKHRAERIAAPEEISISHTLTPAATIVTTTEPVDVAQLHAEFPPVNTDIPHQIEEEVKERATGVWGKVKTWWAKYGWIPVVAVLLIAALFAYLYFARDKRDNSTKQTQQEVQRIEDGKAGLARSEQNLQDMQHRKVDSSYRAALQSIFEQLRQASDQYEAYHAQMIERNELYKIKNDELQKKIASASDDSLLKIGRELSK